MRSISATVLVCLILTTAAGPAYGLAYASGATLDSSSGVSVTSLSHSAGGTSETDDKTSKFKQQTTTSLINVTYRFPTTTLESGTYKAYFVVDGTVSGTVTARVTSINGSSVTGTTATTISGTGHSDKFFAMTYALSSATSIASIGFQIVLSDANRKAEIALDAVALPEPGTWLLFGLGAAVLGLRGRRRRKNGAVQRRLRT